MKYRELQTRLKEYQAAELTLVKLNAKKSTLEREYQRCLQLNLSQKDLEAIICDCKNFDLNVIDPFYIYTNPGKFSLLIIKNKTYQMTKVDNLKEFKLTFPIVKDRKFDFRTKKAWAECLYFVNCITQEFQEFEQFKQEIEALIISIQQQQYQQLQGETAVEEAYEDLSNYISWWKGAQWELALSRGVSILDRLKRTWLEEYLPRHNLKHLLNYNPID